MNMVKVNWNAAINQRNACVGLGLVARDEKGKFLVACGINLKITADPARAEALAAFHEVMFAKELGLSNVIFEGDALSIVNTINSNRPCEAIYGHFVEDVKRCMGELTSLRFIHVVRGANSATHKLAKEALYPCH
jgi:ribonuclease HI